MPLLLLLLPWTLERAVAPLPCASAPYNKALSVVPLLLLLLLWALERPVWRAPARPHPVQTTPAHDLVHLGHERAQRCSALRAQHCRRRCAETHRVRCRRRSLLQARLLVRVRHVRRLRLGNVAQRGGQQASRDCQHACVCKRMCVTICKSHRAIELEDSRMVAE